MKRRMENMFRIVLVVIFILVSLGCSLNRTSLPNIILISIDTLRADHLGCYGYYRNTSPCLDSLAASGTIFMRCQAQAPHTTPAHASIWTGLSVISHGAGYHKGSDYGLDPDLPTIATVLKEKGYNTIGIVNVSILNNDFGFSSGFDYYSWHENGEGRAGIAFNEYLKWLDENVGNPDPVFALIHLYDVHGPYNPPPPYDRTFTTGGSEGITDWQTDPVSGALLNPEEKDHLIDLYDGEISWVDSQLSRLFSELRQRGLAENTLIIVVADHGEEFLEHRGWGHSHAVWQEMLHVPMIISGPGIPVGAVDVLPSGQFDILPTIADYLEITLENPLDGVSLLDSTARTEYRIIPSSRVSPDKCFRWGLEQYEGLIAVLSGNTKAMINYGIEEPGVMFSLGNDPEEMDSLTLDPHMAEALDQYWTTPPVGCPSVLDAESVNAVLKDLGYVR
ncbi:MAG: sulfatase-like hydrolase/transferase [Candidatus Aegiribacteria sp.]|nr:sulfatase-like hydrolase/transferase [Candidatus Aegiribacteria sp.]